MHIRTHRWTSLTLREPRASNVQVESEVNNTRDGGRVSWPMERTWTKVLKWEFEWGTGRLCVPQEQMGRTKVKQCRQKPDQDRLMEQWQSEAGWKGGRSCCLVGTEFEFCKRHLRMFWRTTAQQIEYTWCYRTVDVQMAEKVSFIFLTQFFKLLEKMKSHKFS